MLTNTVFNAGVKTSATQGTIGVPFSELFKDTLATHGEQFAFTFYVRKNGMSLNEFYFWLDANTLNSATIETQVAA